MCTAVIRFARYRKVSRRRGQKVSDTSVVEALRTGIGYDADHGHDLSFTRLLVGRSLGCTLKFPSRDAENRLCHRLRVRKFCAANQWACARLTSRRSCPKSPSPLAL